VFIGHFALAFAAKKAAPEVSLGTLFAASQLPDLLWPPLVLTGVERVRIDPGNTAFTPLDFVHYPWSHSLATVLLWGLLAGLAYLALRGDRRGAMWVGLLAVSHWVLDYLTHRPDLPLWPGGPKVGLELWASVPGTVAVEGGMFVIGVWLYMRATRARDRIGAGAPWALAGFLGAVYAGELFGPPPPSVGAIGVVGLSLWLLVAWAAWADRHRDAAA
jgi:membrane-bound metal-dependent hydrolase YbcI (DUF457 family)